MHEYFFELLTEEIPAWMLPARLGTLRDGLRALHTDFTGKKTGEHAVVVGATSRRIFFVLRDLPERQPDRQDEVKGPPVKAAFDSSRNPTQALNGFLRKNDSSVDNVSVRDDYVWLKRTVSGKSAADVLRTSVPSLVEGLRWPKMMRWGHGEYSFIRPIHSVISVLNGEPLPLAIFGVPSGTTTKGHRILANSDVDARTFEQYATRLRERFVIIDSEERIAELRRRAEELARESGGRPAVDESIWDQWRYLTEFPGLVRAEFDRMFLTLPAEVLITVMRVHQKQLPVLRGNELANSFLAIMDGPADHEGNVASGNAFVTNARFADARFFYEVDRKRPMVSRLEDLSHLQFQEKLGDYRRKTERIVALAEAIGKDAGKSEPGLADAARLCKTDLVTEMVKEFTDLQGKIGGIYAREEGEPEEVWQAIYDHYLPVSAEGEVPRGSTGAIVALADKVDTLCGFFSIGIKPSGSKDPFALRRAAQGVVQILLNREPWRIEIALDRLLDLGFKGFGSTAGRDELRESFAERVRTLLESERYGAFSYDEINAAMEAGWANSLLDLADRLEALRDVRTKPQFLSILDSAKRIANITGNKGGGEVRNNLLDHPTEKRLATLATAVGEQIDELVAERKYRAALESFAGMAPELEKFFVDVLVMVDDQKVRENRLALLSRVGSAVNKIADVTKIVVDRRELAART